MLNHPVAYVVDDDDAMLRLIRNLLRTIDVESRCFSTAAEFFVLYTPLPCACLITDLRMPGMDGLQLQQELQRRQVNVPIIFISGVAEVSSAVEAMRAGAFDFIEKPFSAQTFLSKVQKALDHSQKRHAETLAKQALDSRLALLTPKERDVIAHVVAGKTSREVAESLAISVRTVENHRARIMDKLHVHSVVDLVKLLS